MFLKLTAMGRAGVLINVRHLESVFDHRSESDPNNRYLVITMRSGDVIHARESLSEVCDAIEKIDR